MSIKIDPASFSAPQLAQFNDMPAQAPPPGVKSNFHGPNPQALIFYIVGSVLLAVVYLFVGLRMYGKIWTNRNPGPCDIAAVIAVIGLSGLFGLVVTSFTLGLGKHQWDVTVAQVLRILRFGRYQSIILPPTVLSIKLSILILYFRIFRPDKVARYLIHFGITVCSVGYTVLMFINIFANVEGVIRGSKTTGVLNLVTDIYVLLVPLAAVSKLQLSPKKRTGLILVFLTGILVCIMSVISLVYRCKVQKAEADATYLLASTVLVSTIEMNVGMMCACMPFFPALVKNSSILRKCFRSIQTLKSGKSTSRSTQSMTKSSGSDQKHSGKGVATAESLELGDNRSSTEVTLTNPKAIA